MTIETIQRQVIEVQGGVAGIAVSMVFGGPPGADGSSGTAQISADAGNAITTGTDGKLFVPEASGTGLTPEQEAKLAGIEAGAQVNVLPDWTAATGPTRILNKPTLFSGAYADLSGKPTLGSAAATDASAYATAAQGAKADTAEGWGNHAAVGYLLPAAIGVTVQGFDDNYVVDAGYVHTDNNFTSTLKTKLDGIAAGATANSADAALLARANHTGTQAASTIIDFAAAARAETEAELVAGTNITITPAGSGATRTLTISAAGGGGGGAYEVANWAALLALTGAPDGRVYTVLAPLITGGAPGTQWKRDSASLSGWRPAGRQVIYMSRTGVVGTTTTNEQIQRTLAIPGGVLTGCLMIVPTARTSWSAADGATRTARFRLGALGTIADAQIGVHQTVTAASRQSLHSQAYVADSATFLSQWQMVSVQSTSWIGQVTGTNALTTDGYTVDSMASTIYLSATQQQGGTPTAVPTLEFFALEIA